MFCRPPWSAWSSSVRENFRPMALSASPAIVCAACPAWKMPSSRPRPPARSCCLAWPWPSAASAHGSSRAPSPLPAHHRSEDLVQAREHKHVAARQREGVDLVAVQHMEPVIPGRCGPTPAGRGPAAARSASKCRARASWTSWYFCKHLLRRLGRRSSSDRRGWPPRTSRPPAPPWAEAAARPRGRRPPRPRCAENRRRAVLHFRLILCV